MMHLSVSGSSELRFGLVGCRISYSLSPLIHNAVFKKLNINAVYDLVDIPEENFDNVIVNLFEKYRGFNVTIPYKIRIVKYLTRLDVTATVVGAVNTVDIVSHSDRVGYNTDVIGIVKSLQKVRKNLEGLRVLVLGAGGAARAAIYAVHMLGAGNICVVNRSLDRALELQKHFEKHGIKVSVEAWDKRNSIAPEYDVIINCTPVGTQSNESPLSEGVFRKGQIVLDMVYRPRFTKLLRDAHRAGACIVDGLTVLVYQALAADEIWLGVKVLTEDMYTYIMQILENEVPDSKLPDST